MAWTLVLPGSLATPADLSSVRPWTALRSVPKEDGILARWRPAHNFAWVVPRLPNGRRPYEASSRS